MHAHVKQGDIYHMRRKQKSLHVLKCVVEGTLTVSSLSHQRGVRTTAVSLWCFQATFIYLTASGHCTSSAAYHMSGIADPK